MNKIVSLTLLICGLCASTLMGQIKTPSASTFASLSQEFGLGKIEIEYSRPSKKGREIFGTNALVPNDKLWRTGANQATKITFTEDVMVEGKDLKAGTYAILTKPGKSSWGINFYPYESGNWSSYVDKDPAVMVSVKPAKLQMAFETFTIMVGSVTSNTAVLGLMWDDTYVPVSLKTEVDAKVMASIEKTLSGPTANDYYAAGVYYLNADKDLNKALEYVQKATKGDNPMFWQLRQESLILAKLGRYKEATNVAQKSLDLAKKAGNDDYVKMNNDSIKMWSKK